MDQAIPELDADDAVESTRLEGPRTDVHHPDDAAHWIAVYEELVSTVDRLIGAMRESIPSTPFEVGLLESRVAFFRRRLEWWRAMQRER